MRLPSSAANGCLAVLLAGSGFASLAEFATAVNAHALRAYGLDLRYDRASVFRWLNGAACDHATVVAEVLSRAWGTPVPAAVIWPHTRAGAGPVPAHLHPWAAEHTLTELSTLLRRDAIATHADLAAAVHAADGEALVQVIRRWLVAQPGRLRPPDGAADTVTAAMVGHIEHSTAGHATHAATVGGGLCRDAVAGQLRHTVDLLRHGDTDPVTGNRLLAAVADLAGVLAVMTADAGMPGPSQAYAMFGLHAAHESAADRAPLLVVAILFLLADQLHTGGDPQAGLRLLDLAAARIPPWHHAVQARLHSRRARLLAATAPDRVSDIINAITLSHTLTGAAQPTWHQCILPLDNDADLHHTAADTYLTLATRRPRAETADLAVRAADAAATAVSRLPTTHRHHLALAHLDLATARFLRNQPTAACAAANHALSLATAPTLSRDLTGRLDRLFHESETCRHHDGVDQLRTRIAAITTTPAATPA